MGGKRGNDNSQLTKEDYDRVADSDVKITHGIAKASADVLKRRKIVSVSG